jgi:HAE1 family hydrophobic/amphiphilic exporter-1
MKRTHSSNKFFLLAIAIIAVTFGSAQAQTNGDKPAQTPERIGVDAADALPLSLNEAIRLALENNNDIRTSRIDVEKAEHNLTARRGAYDPQLFSEAYFERSSTPVASFLGGNSNGSLEQKDFTGRIGMSGLAPRYGGSYTFDWSSTRLSSNNFFNALNPAISSRFSLSYTQPLVRGLRTDDSRRQIEIAKKNLTLTDVQFRQRATEVITRVEQSYWELVHALKSLQVQTEAVKQTKAQVETNKRQVAQGVLAPIDVVEAEAQVKIFEQNVYAAQEEVTRAENALKTLMLPDRNAQFWSRALLPVTPVNLEAPRMFLNEAITTALENRFELAELRTSTDINEINKRFYRDQTKPQVDLQVNYSSNGYAGTLSDNENPILTGLTSLERRVAELSTIAGLPVLPPNTFNSIPADMQGGYGRALSNLLGQDNPTVRVGVRISLPLKNRTAKAELGHSLAEGRRLESVRAQTEQMIEAEVRNSIQRVRSVEASMAAAAAARVAAEQQYTSEQRKFQAGMSTVFLVLQRQTDLVMARGRELETQTNLNKAIAEFQRATGNTFRYRNVAVVSDGLRLEQSVSQDLQDFQD